MAFLIKIMGYTQVQRDYILQTHTKKSNKLLPQRRVKMPMALKLKYSLVGDGPLFRNVIVDNTLTSG